MNYNSIKNIIYSNILIVYIFIIIYLSLITICHKKKQIFNINRDIDTYKHQFKSGDLLLFSNDGFVSNTIQFWSDDSFCHSAIIFKINNDIWLLEADMYTSYDLSSDTYKNGPHLIYFDDKAKEYYNNQYVLWCPIKEELDEKKSLKIMEKYKNSRFTDNGFLWYCAKLKFDWFKLSGLKKNDSYFCSELLADFYQEYGLISKETPPHLFTFKDLRNLNIFKNQTYCRINIK